MKKNYLVIVCLMFTLKLIAQGEAANWYFGNGAGISFDINTGVVTSNSNAINTINTNEGCSSISDPNGNLLFYTDGRSVWDANHQVMPNGDYNNGQGLLGDPSSTSSAVIVPKPGNTDQYYIFTVDEPHHNNAWAFPNQGPADINGDPIPQYGDNNGNGGTVPQADDGFNNGFNYSLVDLTLNNGFGDVVTSEKNIHLVTYDPNDVEQEKYKCAEKITAVEHADQSSYWVITHFIDKFYAFRVDSNGVNTIPVVSQIGETITTSGYRRNAIGYIKSSPDGTKLAVCHVQNGNIEGGNQNTTGMLQLFDFDNATGILSNEFTLFNNSYAYGADFSPDSSKLYVSNFDTIFINNRILQYDLNQPNPDVTYQTIHEQSGFLGALQLGPDGKIYVINSQNSNALDVINNPNEFGSAADYQVSALQLEFGTNANLGLPPFIQSFLTAKIEIENVCLGDATQFTIDSSESFVSILWDFGDTTTSTESNPTHVYSAPGTYTITATLTTIDEVKTFTSSVTIYETPFANPINDINLCDDNNDSIMTVDLVSISNPEILGSQDPNTFRVKYFENLEDANNNENEIIIPYSTTSNTQEIFARIENFNESSCFDTTSFFINIFNTPTANSIANVEVCDNANDGDIFNGQVTTFLIDLNPLVLQNQDANMYSISYHTSQFDADSGSNPLSSSYYNQTPFQEEVFVRIENNLFANCYDTTSFQIIVNPIPEAVNTSLFQCDEDGIPEGFTIFNLNQAFETLTGNSPNRSAAYYTSLQDAQNSINAVNPDAFSNTQNPQTLYVQVINDITGCFDIAELLLEVSVTNANDATLTVCDDDGNEDGFYNFNLSDASVIVLDTLPSDAILNYYETYNDALLETNPLNLSFTNTQAYNQTIYARVETNNACYGINEVELIVNKLPQLITNDEFIYCLNSFPDTITLDGGILNGSPNNFYYDWSTNENTVEIEINTIGTYTVTVTNTNGCSKVRTIDVVPSNLATIESIDVIDATSNNSITVNISGEGEYEFAIDNINGIYQDHNTFENVSPGFHTVYVRDINGCGIIEREVSVIGFPKFFTPNNDTYNDTWQVYGINTPNQHESIIYIFDRYGKLLAQLNPKEPGWDGTYNGKPMPTNDYWFYVKLQDGRTYRSHFTLKR